MEKTKQKKTKRNLKTTINKMAKFLSDLLFPENLKCIFCGTDIPNFDEKPYCENCEKQIALNDGNRCMICDQPIHNEAKVCDFCQKDKRFFKKAFCPFLYDGAVKNAILKLKFSNRRYLAKPLAKFIAKRIQDSKTQIDLVTYVPMTRKSEKKRSFNQSKLLATEISELLGVPLISTLVKVKDVKNQKDLNFQERKRNIRDCFKLENPKMKSVGNILIVDDVITTCATINTCAAILSKHAKSVYVCAIAREYVHEKAIVVNQNFKPNMIEV